MAHDLVIRGGRVVDGTGADARTADVAIDDGLVTAVGQVAERGRHELDADGALVTPGWVDIHSHYDGQALNMAAHLEIDDVIDPAETRDRVLHAFASAPAPEHRTGRKRPGIDPW